MDRREFFELAAARGYVRGQKLTQAQKTGIVFDLRDRLSGAALRDAKVHESQGPRDMTLMEAVKALLEELD